MVAEGSSGVDGLTEPGPIIDESERGLVTSGLARGVGLAVGIRFLLELVVRGGRGNSLGGVGLGIGPTTTLGGTIFGAGAGI
jgi:hypothetical protein